MKLYRVMRGTAGKVINRTGAVQEWVVTKNLSFCDTQIDPVRLNNNGPEGYDPQLVELAQQGLAVFVDFSNPAFKLAVPYDQVRVMA